jgi:hypothetical protein
MPSRLCVFTPRLCEKQFPAETQREDAEALRRQDPRAVHSK